MHELIVTNDAGFDVYFCYMVRFILKWMVRLVSLWGLQDIGYLYKKEVQQFL